MLADATISLRVEKICFVRALFLASCLSLFLAACAHAPATSEQAAIDWPQEEEQPAWHLDCLLAKEVVEPVLLTESLKIPLWRFHRRAARDSSGHNFGFLFYSSSGDAMRIFDALRVQPALKELQQRGKVVRLAFDDPANPGKDAVEATSDPQWPLPLQKSWPHYIMGASRMWLDLLDQLVDQYPGASRDEALYRKVQEEINALWRTWGEHALLHHLNALFAYQPLLIRQSIPVRF